MIVRRCASRRALFHDRSILRDYEIAKSAPVVISAIPIPSFQVSGSEHEYDRCDAAANPEITAPAREESAASPASVSVRTVVVKSGTPSCRIVGFKQLRRRGITFR